MSASQRTVASLLAAALLVGVLVVAYWLYLRRPTVEAGFALLPTGFEALPGWSEDAVGDALSALRQSCAALLRRPAETSLGVAGTVADWARPCREADSVADGEPGAAHRYFENHFVPYAVVHDGDRYGLFTGYYEPSLRGGPQPGPDHPVPLLARPDDLVEVDLVQFAEDLAGRRIAGRVIDGRLRPYWSRAEIAAGALDAERLALVWVSDEIDLFFLQIQGSGRVEMENGDTLRVGYAGQNGHPYFAIGRALVERGAMTVETVSMQAIRDWLVAHPDEARAVMNLNPSYVFFRVLDGPGPLGAQGVPLTPRRSLAVDRRFVPFGVPVWLETEIPGADDPSDMVPWHRLLIAQDTGGAIRGAVRGDVFWGHGEEAEYLAGHMKSRGRYWLLLPRGTEPREARR